MMLLEKEGLSPFVLGSVPAPPVPTETSSTEDLWLYARWYDFEMRLRDTYLLPSEVTIARLETELSTLTWKEGTNLDVFISEIDNIADQLRGCGQTVSDSKLRVTLLKGLPDTLSSVKHILLEMTICLIMEPATE